MEAEVTSENDGGSTFEAVSDNANNLRSIFNRHAARYIHIGAAERTEVVEKKKVKTRCGKTRYPATRKT